MADFEKFKRAAYMPKRMYILRDCCETLGLKLEYLFGLFNYYNNKNKGRWFWQKATFTGVTKDSYETFNKTVDNFIKEIKGFDENTYKEKLKDLCVILDNLLKNMEVNLSIDRQKDIAFVEGNMDNNLRALIKDALRGF